MSVVSVGTCNMDFIFRVPRFVEPDSEMNIEDLNVIPGGSAFNFAVWISHLGFKAGVVSSVGRDVYGDMITSLLEFRGVDTSFISRQGEKTGMAFISVDDTGRRSIYSYMGANASLKIGEAESEYIMAADAVHLSGCYLEVASAVSGIRNVSFSPGTLLASYGIERLSGVLERTSIIFLNDDELEMLTGSGRSGIERLLEAGVGNVVVTHGPRGASFFSEDHSETLEIEAEDALDTTGAGDAFAAGFMSMWLRGSEPAECLRNGHRVARRVISRIGAF
ncbi:carbohydrate kinase family protein [Methanothermobacter marburgensis]|uniref:Predicted ribokinase n=1 Tax=Methanothermobacter marburgensis (strain ATCC BAA-927 / DSM 2133 / JCM 14651 / NBRC 100331 / OCM 82 / Marburg) TaxID=79929 RepID=D9PUW5_METTM|nr:carbohydrate kinase family protein [Methanothermobacter marburgensis]ADL58012.1 predicted ribokinase [Methanothermobacter marburgensis str. Marburg]